MPRLHFIFLSLFICSCMRLGMGLTELKNDSDADEQWLDEAVDALDEDAFDADDEAPDADDEAPDADDEAPDADDEAPDADDEAPDSDDSGEPDVEPSNGPPSITSADCPVEVRENNPYHCFPEATDPDNDPLEWHLDSSNTCAWAVIDPLTGEITGTPTAFDVGMCRLRFYVQDNRGLRSGAETIDVTVLGDQPPAATTHFYRATAASFDCDSALINSLEDVDAICVAELGPEYSAGDQNAHSGAYEATKENITPFSGPTYDYVLNAVWNDGSFYSYTGSILNETGSFGRISVCQGSAPLLCRRPTHDTLTISHNLQGEGVLLHDRVAERFIAVWQEVTGDIMLRRFDDETGEALTAPLVVDTTTGDINLAADLERVSGSIMLAWKSDYQDIKAAMIGREDNVLMSPQTIAEGVEALHGQRGQVDVVADHEHSRLLVLFLGSYDIDTTPPAIHGHFLDSVSGAPLDDFIVQTTVGSYGVDQHAVVNSGYSDVIDSYAIVYESTDQTEVMTLAWDGTTPRAQELLELNLDIFAVSISATRSATVPFTLVYQDLSDDVYAALIDTDATVVVGPIKMNLLGFNRAIPTVLHFPDSATIPSELRDGFAITWGNYYRYARSDLSVTPDSSPSRIFTHIARNTPSSSSVEISSTALNTRTGGWAYLGSSSGGNLALGLMRSDGVPY